MNTKERKSVEMEEEKGANRNAMKLIYHPLTNSEIKYHEIRIIRIGVGEEWRPERKLIQ